MVMMMIMENDDDGNDDDDDGSGNDDDSRASLTEKILEQNILSLYIVIQDYNSYVGKIYPALV